MNKIVAGIDIGGTNTVYGLVDYLGKCIVKDSFPTKNFAVFEDFIKELSARIQSLFQPISSKYILSGIGIGAPNGNYYKGTIEYAPNLNWYGIVNVSESIKRYFDLPVVLTNDANATALGEMMYGGAIDMKDFIVITLGTGLGSGIVVNGQIVYGHDGFAGEIGHTTVDPEGRSCGCGKKGCLETYVSASGLKKTVFELLKKSDKPSLLREISDFSGVDIDNAARNGDEIALEAFEFTGKILGIKLADAIAHTSPEAIFLYGGLAKAGELIFKPTKKYMEEFLLPIYKNKVQLIPSLIEDSNAAVLGAAALIWNEIN
ncbi:MAG: ROK family protein [Bacteroidota bacterium]